MEWIASEKRAELGHDTTTTHLRSRCRILGKSEVKEDYNIYGVAIVGAKIAQRGQLGLDMTTWSDSGVL